MRVYTSCYGHYKRARNASWSLLIDHGVDRLPVPVSAVARGLGVRLLSCDRAEAALRSWALGDLPSACAGAALRVDDGFIILYDPSSGYIPRIRFTVAHELGHILLGHLMDGPLFRARRNDGDLFESDDQEEAAANQFAARVLAPACVLWGLDLHTPDEIAVATGLSHKAANYRADRMKSLYRRDMFLSHPLEREVYAQFLPWIRRHNPNAPSAGGM